jgi:hypothetical protein
MAGERLATFALGRLAIVIGAFNGIDVLSASSPRPYGSIAFWRRYWSLPATRTRGV